MYFRHMFSMLEIFKSSYLKILISENFHIFDHRCPGGSAFIQGGLYSGMGLNIKSMTAIKRCFFLPLY